MPVDIPAPPDFGALPTMDSAAMEGVMTNQTPVQSITWVRTGDAGLDLISLVLKYCESSALNPESTIRALQYAQDRIKERLKPNPDWRDASRIEVETREHLMRELAKFNTQRNDNLPMYNSGAGTVANEKELKNPFEPDL